MSPHYGCHNRAPFLASTELRDHHGRIVSSWPNVMRKDCAYTTSDLGAVDARCAGCKHNVAAQNATAGQ